MEPDMRVQIDDDNDNWRKWGELVESWINDPTKKPGTTDALKAQMAASGVQGTVPGAPRPVTINFYPDDPNNDPLVIWLPSQGMLAAKLGTIPPAGPYPLPKFYDVAYGGAARANLTADQCEAFALQRVGEYTINECC
jgi:hypothetical protein